VRRGKYVSWLIWRYGKRRAQEKLTKTEEAARTGAGFKKNRIIFGASS
jgi:hypothetical protein